MEYGKRWHIEFDTRLKGKCEVDIFKKNYTGSVELVEKYSADPLVLSAGDVSDNPFEPLQGSDILLSLITYERLRFIEMFSADMKKHYCEVKYNGVLDGKYWFVVDLYNEPYNKPPFAVSLRAVDGIGLLKNLTFDLRGNQTIKNTIKHILDKIGFNLPIDVVNEIYEVSSGSNIHFLDTLKKFDYLDDKEDATYCDEILEQLLLSAESRIMQREGKWVIEQIPELDKVHTLRHFDSSFNSLGTEQVDLSLQTTQQHESNFCKLKVSGAQLEALPAWKQFGVTQNYYKKENALPGGTLTESSLIFALKGSDISYNYPIIVDGSLTYQHVTVPGENYYHLRNWQLSEGILDNKGTGSEPFVGIGPKSDFTKYLLNNSLLLKQGIDKFRIKFELSVLSIAVDERGRYIIPALNDADVRLQIKCGILYIDPQSGWTETPSYITVDNLKNTSATDIYTIDIHSGNIPDNQPLEIKIWNPKDPNLQTELFIKSVSVVFMDSNDKEYVDKNDSIVIVDIRNNITPSTFELDFVDLPDFTNTLNAFAGGMLLSNGWHTKLWQYNGKQDKLANLMALQYVAGFAVPRFKIKAGLYSDTLHRGSILSDIGSGDRKFLMGKCSYSARNSEWSGVEWLELPTYPIKGELEAMFIGSISDSVLNVFGPNAIDDGDYIIFPQLTKDVFDITNVSYWHADFQNLADFDPAQPRRWKKTWLSGPEIIEYALPEVQKYLFFKDIEGDELQTSMPIMTYSEDQTLNNETIEEFLGGYFWLYDGADLLEDNGSVLIENV